MGVCRCTSNGILKMFSPSGTHICVSEGLAYWVRLPHRRILLHAVERQFYILHAIDCLAKLASAHVGL